MDGSNAHNIEITAKSQTVASKFGLVLQEKPQSNNDVAGLKVTDRKSILSTLNKLDKALDKVGMERAELGAFQNRLEASISNLNQSRVNLIQARSRMMDVDYAEETQTLAKNQILAQASNAMLAQAKRLPSSVMQLLR